MGTYHDNFSTPSKVEIKAENIPPEIVELTQWCVWAWEKRDGKLTKPPHNPMTGGLAKSNDPGTWVDFKTAYEAYKFGDWDGIGFFLTSPYLGLDYDDSIVPETGDPHTWALNYLKSINSYSEISPSGTGIKTLVKARLPGKAHHDDKVGIFDNTRFFCITGDTLPGVSQKIEERQQEINSLCRERWPKDFETKDPKSPNKVNEYLSTLKPSSVSDLELIKRMKAAKNGNKFKTLWSGNIKRFPSHSEGDLALCSMLAFQCRGDPDRIDRLFRLSGLYREKWNREDYAKRTIETALSNTISDHDKSHEKIPDIDAGPSSFLDLNLPTSLEVSRINITVRWVVNGLIPQESLTLLHSIGGVGKSYLMYGLGKAVADGISFFDLGVMKMPVYYVDFENPLPEIVDRLKKIGGSSDMRIWHLGHDPMPVRIDADEWTIFKTFPPGLFIIDSLRSSHLLEENSSKDAAFVMSRFKEVRVLGNTIVLVHHENKLGGYRGSSAWFDLSDHILKFGRVPRIGSDEDADQDDFTLPIRLGLGGKSRFSSAMEFRPMFFRFEDHQLCIASNPDEAVLEKIAKLLNPETPPNQGQLQKLVQANLGIGRKGFEKFLRQGMGKYWRVEEVKARHEFLYYRT